ASVKGFKDSICLPGWPLNRQSSRKFGAQNRFLHQPAGVESEASKDLTGVQLAGAGLPLAPRAAGATALSRKLTHRCRGKSPRAMMKSWLTTNPMSHLNAACVKP